MHGALAIFLVQAIVIVALSRALGAGARRIGQPLVVTEIIAGIVLGPSVLGALWPKLGAALFPASSLALLGGVSQLGLVLFMFLVGLELDPSFLRGRGRTSVVISHSSIIVPFALGALLAVWLHGRYAPAGTSFTAFALFVGVAMSITAFPVLARILTERRMLGTEIGAMTIACAAIDDITAWCLLAFVVAVAKSAGLGVAVTTTVLTIGYVAAMAFVVRPLLAKLAERHVGRDAIDQGTVAATLILLLASASATELIGIHALFGAFAFGVVIPRRGNFAHAIAEKTEDLVVVLLLPLFFAYSGLRTQIGLIHGEGWLTCLAVIAVACLGKFGGSYAAARFQRIPPRDAGILGVLMNTRGLMELVVLNIGLDLGVISPALFTMMVLMALVTTVMTTPILHLLMKSAPETREPTAISTPVPSPATAFSVLVCTAYERSAAGMLSVARALTAGSDRVYALRLEAPTDRSSRQIAAHTGDTRLSTLSGLAEQASDVSLRTLSFVSSDPARDICDVATVKAVDLVVVGWHRPWFGSAPLGGTVQRVLGRATAKTAVLIDRDLREVRSVLVVLQGTSGDTALLKLAQRMIGGGREVSVLDLTAGRSDARLASFGIDPHTVRRGAVAAPDDSIVRESKSVDLVVVGLDGPLADGRLFDRVPRSLLLVRPPIAASAPVRTPLAVMEVSS